MARKVQSLTPDVAHNILSTRGSKQLSLNLTKCYVFCWYEQFLILESIMFCLVPHIVLSKGWPIFEIVSF